MFALAALMRLIPQGVFSCLGVTLGYVRRFRRRHGDKLARLHPQTGSDAHVGTLSEGPPAS